MGAVFNSSESHKKTHYCLSQKQPQRQGETMIKLILSFITGFVAVAWPAWTWVNTTPALPQVDLGYEIHEALAYNVSGYSAVAWQVPLSQELNPTKKTTRQFIFRNIRYAQAPTGDLRLAPPVAPTGVNPVVQRGNESRICPQNMLGNLSDLEESLQVPGTTEDCLFLDVVVPRQVFDGRGPCPTKIFVHFQWASLQLQAILHVNRGQNKTTGIRRNPALDGEI